MNISICLLVGDMYPTTLGTYYLVECIQRREHKEAFLQFTEVEKIITRILSAHLLTEIKKAPECLTEWNSLPEEHRRELNGIECRIHNGLSRFVDVASEFKQSLETCPGTLVIALQSIEILYSIPSADLIRWSNKGAQILKES